jgi:N-acetylneuraminic acid mutarotase
MNAVCILKNKNLLVQNQRVSSILRFKNMISGVKAILLLCVFCSGLFLSCSKDTTVTLVGNWVRKSDLDGVARGDGASFVIGTKGYLCGGYDGKNRLRDLWEYSADNNSWTQKASLPEAGVNGATETAAARNSATGFSIGSKGYIGNGYDGDTYLKDYWEYDPSANSWTRKADFGGSARYNAIGFGSSTYGYVGTGFDGNYQKDFWKLDPIANTWTQTNSIIGAKRTGAFVFVIDNKAYVGGGVNNGTYVDDFNVFDMSNDTWTEKRRIANVSTDTYDDEYAVIVRAYGVGLAINGKGYVATGESAGNTQIVWEYEPSTDLWTKKQNFEATGRSAAVGFSFGTSGYITTGRSSSYRFDDLWEFRPMDDFNSND